MLLFSLYPSQTVVTGKTRHFLQKHLLKTRRPLNTVLRVLPKACFHASRSTLLYHSKWRSFHSFLKPSLLFRTYRQQSRSPLLFGITGALSAVALMNVAAEWKDRYSRFIYSNIRCEGVQIRTRQLESLAPVPSNTQLFWMIWKHLKPDGLLLTSIICVTLGSALINIVTPMVMGQLVTIIQTSLSTGGTWIALNAPSMKLLGLFLMQGLLTCIDIALVSRLGENMSYRIRMELYQSLLYKDIEFFDKNMQGLVTSRLTQDVADFKHTFKLMLTQGLKCCTQVVGTAIHLFILSKKLTLTLLMSMPVLYVGLNMYGSFLRHISKLAKHQDSVASGVAGEAIANIRTVRAFAAEDRELMKYSDAVASSCAMNTHLGWHIGAFQGLTNASIGGMILTILYYGGHLVTKGDMTGGQLMTYMVATQNAQKSLSMVGVLFGQTIKAFASAGRIFEYVQHEQSIPIKGGKILEDFKGRIEFRNVEFTYPARPDHTVLKSFNLVLPKGKVVALCGGSGGGKSTVGQLIERFYDPHRGLILIDGVDIKELDPSWLRRQVGYINQEPVLFATSIFENIRYGRPDATLEQVKEAARLANAHQFIESFPQSYNTLVGERGVTLSGGQKQRIAIARAILKDPTILILDEATSALDTHSERLVQEALDRLMQNRTVLVIAHRLSTIQNADMIVVMRGSTDTRGNIVESGTHQELMNKKGFYYNLYNKTLLEP